MTTAECGRQLNEWARECGLTARPVGHGVMVMVGGPGVAFRVTLNWMGTPHVQPLGGVTPQMAARLQALLRAWLRAR